MRFVKPLQPVPFCRKSLLSATTNDEIQAIAPSPKRNIKMENNAKTPPPPPLTHFLCLPLVNENSLPLIESSLNTFCANIPPKNHGPQEHHPLRPIPLLFPDAAIRPLGTLHLTLGVMRLNTPERLAAAMDLLRDLDLGSMLRDAQTVAATTACRGGEEPLATRNSGDEVAVKPLSISLESLAALPRPKQATVLYAKPVDPTNRLYQFGFLLQAKFFQAGLIEGEQNQKQHKKKLPKRNQKQNCLDWGNDEEKDDDGDPYNEDDEKIRHPSSAITTIQKQQQRDDFLPQSAPVNLPARPRPRPLLLHATVVNTIYLRRGPGAFGKGKSRKPFTFDARRIIAHYEDYYIDDNYTQVRPYGVNTPGMSADNYNNKEDSETESQSSESSSPPSDLNPSNVNNDNERDRHRTIQKYPFVWAQNVTLDRLCICEMGARTIVDENSHHIRGNIPRAAARLGQEYRVVAERSLLDLTSPISTDCTGPRVSLDEQDDSLKKEERGVN
jgi:activating signal cointegrator complex subunit 1